MVKYTGHYITFQEVPNEISLVLTISGCPHHCPGCHSPWLQQDIGDPLTTQVLFSLMAQYSDAITCVCFMGDGGDPSAFAPFAEFVHLCGFKTCLYSGADIDHDLHLFQSEPPFDYIKTGSYVESLGGLDHPTTNQRMWKLSGVDPSGAATYEDITHLFWKEKT